MADETSSPTNTLVEFCLRLGDDRLILGHRLSEWCGHGPILEEDIALANIALDLLGQATRALEIAGKAEGAGRSADDLAFFREAVEFRNLLLVELPRGDFAFTIARQFFFDAFSVHLMDALQKKQRAADRGTRGEGGEGRSLSRSPQRGVDGEARRWNRGESRADSDSGERAVAFLRRDVSIRCAR